MVVWCKISLRLKKNNDHRIILRFFFILKLLLRVECNGGEYFKKCPWCNLLNNSKQEEILQQVFSFLKVFIILL